jgi:hypothetical protein
VTYYIPPSVYELALTTKDTDPASADLLDMIARGLVEVIPPAPCPSCDGGGWGTDMHHDGSETTFECPTCHGKGWL